MSTEAQEIFHELRCVVCAGESIAESRAEVAEDMRRVVREKLAAGESPQEIKAYFAAQYGDQILMRPPLSPATLGLWGGPLLMALLGAWLLLRYFKSCTTR